MKILLSFIQVQFILIFVHTLQAIIRKCIYPLWYDILIYCYCSFVLYSCRGLLMLGGYMITMFILFTNFYIHEYITRSNDLKRIKQQSNDSHKISESQRNRIIKKYK